RFAGRISPALNLKEVEEKKLLPPAELKRREGELLRAAAAKGAIMVALDEKGLSLTSQDFADRIGGWRDQGTKNVAFFIGGANGLDDGVLKEAALVLSLGAMTWPHLLVRGLLAEQVYRAQCILSGHPYHRE
ncbi:MAG: 23S rRNA (pseudouridine(1915)-N(3))-methyltransferase RlmH, partial [Rhodospirillales bacterium]|nr:23S rRNA (pseudouridine(1915)-N(3))-methyltransferase RlmH [Rhodospirillales bacterium]